MPHTPAEHLFEVRRTSKGNPLVPHAVRAERIVSASFDGLIARLRMLGWRDEIILQALSQIEARKLC
jgi:hypothetical protein